MIPKAKTKISFRMNNEVKVTEKDNINNTYPPTLPNSLLSREIIDDHGLIEAKSYLMGLSKEHINMDMLYTRFPKEMIDEMVDVVLKHVPDATETQIAITILDKLTKK